MCECLVLSWGPAHTWPHAQHGRYQEQIVGLTERRERRLGISEWSGRCGVLILGNLPHVAATRTPQVPVPDRVWCRDRQRATLNRVALRARKRIGDVKCRDGQPFIRVVRAARHAPRRNRAGSSQKAIADVTAPRRKKSISGKGRDNLLAVIGVTPRSKGCYRRGVLRRSDTP
jgi:hypothetical protein